jgi:RNA polymerase sigma-70 factor (ECF subfamily)
VLRYCLRCLRRPADAEDALQQTFLQAHRALERGVEPAVEEAWLLAIARNVCVTRSDALRRRAHAEVPTDVELVAETLEADDEVAAEVHAALTALPRRQRDALFLREWHELSYAEIAHVLGTTEPAVETLVFRARRALERELAPLRRRGGLDVAALLGWARGAAGWFSAKAAAVGTVAALTAGAATTVVVERRPAPKPVPSPAAVVAPHVARAVPAPVSTRSAHRVAPTRKVVPRATPVAHRASLAQPSVPAVAAPVTPAVSEPEAAPVAPPAPAASPAATQPAPAQPGRPEPATSVVQQTATTATSVVDTVVTTVDAAVPAAAPVTSAVSDTVDKTVDTVSKTADAATSTVSDTVSSLLGGH